MESLRGHLLIAPPHLTDPNFSRTVVLMIQHDDEGAFGVILNRRTERSIRDLWSEIRGETCRCDQHLNLGGPVTGPLVALHTEPALAELPVVPGVYCTMDAGNIAEVVDGDRKMVRFYAGYAGWGARQLEAEMQTGSWLTTKASAHHVFGTDEEVLWRNALRQASGTADFPLPGTTGEPHDPSLN